LRKKVMPLSISGDLIDYPEANLRSKCWARCGIRHEARRASMRVER
jgi:hypothetical protein